VGYGELTYLLASFVAIRALLDLGTSSAFFTFIAKARRDHAFYAQYFGWLALQFVVSFMLVAVIFPQSVLDHIWLGQERSIVLLALVASFLQQQVWATISQIGEASRLTVRVQTLSLVLALTHLAVIGVLLLTGALSVRWVLLAIITELVLVTLLAVKLLRVQPPSAGEITHLPPRELLRNYWRFCRPLILVAFVGFLYDFADKWLLQKFGGADQQGYYQIASQLAAVSLLATTSIMNIFWKEIAHAGAQRDAARLAMLYNRVNRGLVLLGAAVSGFLIPWAPSLVEFLLGPAYVASWPILMLMLLYPIHQSMGQVNATMFLASECTNVWMVISIIGQLVCLPVTFVLLAPHEGYLLPGLALGALGLAIKMVGMNALLTNIQAALLARFNGWRFHWLWQVSVIGGLLLLGYAAHGIAMLLLPSANATQPSLLVLALTVAGLLYLMGLALFVRSFPTLLGCDRQELRELARRFLPATLARLA
jgi:O-antigen/teichoic acid export membrane protein